MKICYINPTILVRRPIADLIELLGDEHEIALVVPRKPFQKVDESWHSNTSLKKARILSYPAVNLPFLKSEWPIPASPLFLVQLIRAFREYRVIHLWTFFYLSSMLSCLLKLIYPKTKLIMSSDTFPGYSFDAGTIMNTLFTLYLSIFAGFLFSIPDKIHLYGKSMVPFALRAGVSKDKITIIPTGIFPGKFQKAKPISRQSLGVKDNRIMLFYAGLLIPRKGIDTALHIVKELCNQGKNPHLVLAGDGPGRKYYENLVLDLNLKNRVSFLGWRKDIPQLLKTADVLLFPSRGEGLPGIVMEALAAELPVVASDIPGVNDLVNTCAPPNDVAAFVKLLKNPACSKSPINSWENLKQNYLRMYV